MKTVAIIGAGPAGLTAAYTLLNEDRGNWHVTVFEENDFPGGISRTTNHCGNRIDIGGHRFFSKSSEVNALWDALMPRQGAPAKDDIILGRQVTLADDGPDPERESCVMLRRHRVSRIYFRRHFFDYPISVKPATMLAMGLFNSLAAGLSYLKSICFKRPEKSLEDFYVNRFGHRLYSMFFEDYTEKLWGIHPSRISPEWGAQRVKGLSVGKALVNLLLPRNAPRETSLIEEFSYPKLGPGQFWEEMARRVVALGGEIRYNTKVVSVEPGWSVNGQHFDAVFSSMPVKDLVAAMPNPPAHVSRVSDALPYRDFMTVGLLVDRLALRNRTRFATVRDIIPDTWIYVQERDVRLGRIQVFNNWSPYMVDDVERHVWIGLEYFCSEGDDLWQMSDSDFIDFAAKELRKIGVIAHDEPILDSVRIRVPKAYPAYFGSYANFSEVRRWLDSLPGLYCIGRNGQHRYNNMDHSMLCGMRAARALATGADKESVWNVNTEEDYHESAG